MKDEQVTRTGIEFQKYTKTTRRATFLPEMDRVVLWAELCALAEPVYPKGSTGAGRPPVRLERLSRIHFLQQWLNLSDPAVEEAPYHSTSMRAFFGIDFGAERAPGESTVCRFTHLLERDKLRTRIFPEVGCCLQSQARRVSSGTIVDATIISAPSLTRNARGERDPEMHQTKKGKDLHLA